ncbi:hypothetical protein ACIHEI_37190 [Kitasatospora sp. NPDC051984]|uniref:hypothetical protein n=1 Tax=Kitasatospora sp. NPDC051984 TaxID=3364059 RepID=UPI0037C9F8A1
MQPHELTAWLGDDHGLTDEQFADLLARADDIEARYPDPDDREEAQAALTVAYRLAVEDSSAVVAELAAARSSARTAELAALAGLRQAANQLIPAGDRTESGFAREGGVDRQVSRLI